MRDAVSAAWSLLGNRLGAQGGVADPNAEYLASLHSRLADRPRPWVKRHQPPTLPLDSAFTGWEVGDGS